MYRIVTLSLLMFCEISHTSCDLFERLSKGMDLGYGFKLHFDEIHKENNTSLPETKSVRLNYNGFGFSMNKLNNNDKEIVQFDIYFNEKEEGRGKKVGQILLPAIIGMKITGLTAITFISLTMFVLKALTISKLALLSAAGLLITKLFFYKSKVNHVEGLEHLTTEYQPNYYLTQGANEENYHNYLNYDTNKDVVGESSGQFASILPATNITTKQVNRLQITKRSDALRRIPQASYIMFRKIFH